MKTFKIMKIKKSHSKSLALIQKENSKEIGNNLWNENEINLCLGEKNFFGSVCFYEKSIKGFIFGREISDFLELISIFVIPSYREKGIGSKMLESCKIFCKFRTLKEIILEVGEDNTIAKEFYLKKNFYIFGKRKKYYDLEGEKIDAFLMKLKI